MPTLKERIQTNLQRIRLNVETACERAGRSPEEVQLVAVTKAVDLPEIRALLELGVTNLGENRAQQLAARCNAVDDQLQQRGEDKRPEVRWHMIGHLQRNKVKNVVGRASMIHSVDSLRLAEEISSRAGKAETTANVLLQVNCSQEPQKHGLAVGAATHLGETVAALEHVRLCGLMTMAAFDAYEDEIRNTFERLREIFEEMRSEKIGGEHFRHLSMGMSQDYPLAVEQGATLIRVGTALFE